GDGADRAELSHTVGGADSTEAANPRVPVSSVTRIQLVAASDVVDARVVDDGVMNGKGEVASDSEDVIYPDVLQPSKHMLDHCLCHDPERPPGRPCLTTRCG